MKKHIYALFILLSTFGINHLLAQQVSVTSTTGAASGNYSTLKLAFDSINSGYFKGVINIRINATTTETASASLNASGVGNASYTSVLIRPADTAISLKRIQTTTTGLNLINLEGADYVTFDGRAGGTGTTSLLEVYYNVTTTGASTSVGLRNNNGATFNTFNYMTFTNLSSQATSGAANISIINSSTGFAPNNNLTITNCIFTGARNSIILDGTNNSGNATTDNLLIQYNTIKDFGLSGVNLGLNTGIVTVDSNVIYHTSGFTSSNSQSPRGISCGSTTQTTLIKATITRNRIYDLKASTSGVAMFGIIASLSTYGTANNFDIINNSIVLMQTNAAVNSSYTSGCNGILTQGNNPGTINVYQNTVRIGGVSSGSVASTSTVRGYGFMCFHNNSSVTINAKNNLFIVTRTGNTTTGVTNFYLGAVYYYAVNTFNVDNNVYYGNPYTVAWPSAAGGVTITTNIQTYGKDLSSTTKLPTFSNTQQPYLSGTSLGDADLSAPPLRNVTNDIDNVTRSTQVVYKGASEASTAFTTNDLAATIIYTYGRIPSGTSNQVRIRVKNNAVVANMNPTFTLNIVGANTTTITVSVSAISALADTIISFPAYTPINIGFDTLKVTVPSGDQNPANDLATWLRETTLNALSYANPSAGQTGNVGTNGTGEIIAKFYTPVANYVNQVNVNFTNAAFSGPWPFAVVIYEDSGSTYGPKMNPLWVSSSQNTVNGIYNLSIPSVSVSGNFFIGVRQTSSNNIGFAYQNENPIRNQTFYFRQGTTYSTASWNDFAVNASNQFRFMIEPRLKINNDLGVIDLTAPGTGCLGGSNNDFTVKVQNLGLLTQDFSAVNLNVYGSVTNPSNVTTTFGPVTINSGTLVTDGILNVNLTNSLNLSTAGNYVFKAWTVYSVDNNAVNDTLSNTTRTVTVANTAPYASDFNGSTALPTDWSTNRFTVSAGNGVASTNSVRVNVYNTNTFTANAYIVSPRITNITSTSSLRFAYRIKNWSDGLATILTNLDSIKIQISTDCGNTFSNAYVIVGSGHTPSLNFKNMSVNLGNYAASDIRIKFLLDWFGTTNNAYVDIDNIRVVDPQTDIAPAEPSGMCQNIPLTASTVIGTSVSNMGQNNISSAKCYLVITGPSNFSDSLTISGLNAGTSTSVNFSSFTPSIAGTYNVKIYTNYNGDNDLYNDTSYATFIVVNTNLYSDAGNHINFNSNFYAKAANSSSLNISGSGLTIESWVNRNAAVSGNKMIISKDSASIRQYALSLDALGYLYFTTTTTNGTVTVYSAGADSVIADWTHVSATYDGSEMRLYINGRLVGYATQSGNLLAQVSDIYIGESSDGTQRFNGRVDELKIWNTALSAKTLRDSLHTRLYYASSANLMAYYRFDESGTTVIDNSGNCNNLSVVGTSVFSSTGMPLGRPVVEVNYVIGATTYSFPNANMDLIYNSYSGTMDSVYVYYFAGLLPSGTSSAAAKAGTAKVHPGYWVAQRYGDGVNVAYDVNFKFTAGELNPDITGAYLFQFTRVDGSSGAWTYNSSASSASFASQTASYTQSLSSSFGDIFNNQIVIGDSTTAPAAPISLSVSGANSTSFTANWATTFSANNYRLDVSLNRNFTTYLSAYNNLTVNATSKNITGLTANTWYYFRVRAVNSTGTSSNSAIDSAFTTPASIAMNITMFIQGYYTGSNTMSALLYSLDNSLPTNYVDTISVSLVDANTYSTAYSTKGILLSNGSLSVNLNGNASGGSYYVVVKGLNLIETWSAAPLTMSSTNSYDFSSSANNAYGSNAINDGNGVYLLYNGDINQDGTITNDDVVQLDNDNSSFASGYLATDLTGDGIVSNDDAVLLDNNNSNFVATAHP